MARVAAVDIEKRWYDVWSGWDKADREIAMRVLAQLHPRLSAKPSKREPEAPTDSVTLSPEAQQKLAIGDKHQ